MAIPESQLDTWSHQGSVTQSSGTYQTVRNALLDPRALYADRSYNVFLQGSYGNDTNIYAESDVDTVIRLDSIFRGNIDALPLDQQNAWRTAFATDAVYTFAEFKSGVVTRLSTAFGEGLIDPGNKAIKVLPNQSRRSADVVVCYEYRRYTRYISYLDNSYISGIIFPSSSSGEIINYPALHSSNLTAKHQATNGWFKPLVRIFKNARSRLVDDGIIQRGTAPSYYVEGMIHNVPNEQFGQSYGASMRNSLSWLCQSDRTNLLCAHQQHRLLGNSNVQWSASDCTLFLNSLVTLWNEW